jgi:hypothetical protein
MLRFSLVAITLVGLALMGVRYTHGAVPQCQLSLTLLIDSSGSINADQRQLIREGTVWALMHPTIEPSLVGNGIIIRVGEYGERTHEMVPPTMLASKGDLEAVAAALMAAPSPGLGSNTGTGTALLWAREGFRGLPCYRNVVDVLTDGDNNTGIAPQEAHMEYRESDQINVLFVGNEHELPAARRIQFGALAFTLPIAGFEDVGKGLLRKLSIEVSWGLADPVDVLEHASGAQQGMLLFMGEQQAPRKLQMEAAWRMEGKRG